MQEILEILKKNETFMFIIDEINKADNIDCLNDDEDELRELLFETLLRGDNFSNVGANEVWDNKGSDQYMQFQKDLKNKIGYNLVSYSTDYDEDSQLSEFVIQFGSQFFYWQSTYHSQIGSEYVWGSFKEVTPKEKVITVYE